MRDGENKGLKKWEQNQNKCNFKEEKWLERRCTCTSATLLFCKMERKLGWWYSQEIFLVNLFSFNN